jgi:hypothetical protein
MDSGAWEDPVGFTDAIAEAEIFGAAEEVTTLADCTAEAEGLGAAEADTTAKDCAGALDSDCTFIEADGVASPLVEEGFIGVFEGFALSVAMEFC